MEFCHLHTHTEYSLLDGEASIKKLISRVKELGMTSCAITDHGSMYGVVDFYREAKAQGIHPVIGCEVYMAPRTRFDKVHDIDNKTSHLILLAENQTGYQSVAEREGVDRLQEVDLQNVHQLVGFRDHGVQKQVAVHAARKNQHPGVHRRHAQPHRNHHQRFEHAPAPQVNQQDTQQY